MNNITILGRLTDKPEMKSSQDNKPIAKFSLADNRGQDKVSFFRCTAFGKTAELIGNAEKGHRLLVIGRMEEDKWIDQATQTERRSWEVIVNEMSYIEAAPQQHQPAAPAPAPYQPPAGYQPPHGQYAPPPPPAPVAAALPTTTDTQGNLYELRNNQWVMIRPAGAPPAPPAAPPRRPF